MGLFDVFKPDERYTKSREVISRHKELDKAFVESFEFDGMLLYKDAYGRKIIINEQTQQVCFYSEELCPKFIVVDKFYQDKPLFYRLFNFNEIYRLRFITHKKIIAEQNSGIGSAIVGGMLFGFWGAVLGAYTAGYTKREVTDYIEIVVSPNDLKQPLFRFKAFIGCGKEHLNQYGIDRLSHAYDILNTLVENAKK